MGLDFIIEVRGGDINFRGVNGWDFIGRVCRVDWRKNNSNVI